MKHPRAIIYLVIIALLLCTFSGCGKSSQSGMTIVPTTEIEATENEITGQTPLSVNDPYEKETDLKPYYEYADTVYDRSAVEGKLAVYFIRGDADMDTYESNTVSGDSTLIIAPNGETMLIDCNMTSCASFIVAMLQRLGISRLDYFMVSHPHGDHIGGWETLLRYIEIGKVYGSQILMNKVIWGQNYVVPTFDREHPEARNMVSLSCGPIALAIDENKGYDALGTYPIAQTEDGTVQAVEAESVHGEYLVEKRIPLKDGKTVTLVDYASAGKIWNNGRKITVWLRTQ